MVELFTPASEIFDAWKQDVLCGPPPVRYQIGNGAISQVDVRPGRVLLFGGGPGDGKTAFTMQAVVDALRCHPDLRVLVCNVDMPTGPLLERQLARISGVPVSEIMDRRVATEHHVRIERAMGELSSIAGRLSFLAPPFTMRRLLDGCREFGAGIVLADYIQCIAPLQRSADKREAAEANMYCLREMADSGVAVLVVSAVARGRGANGQATYDGDTLGLGSFRESSGLEFGCDSAFLVSRCAARTEHGAGWSRIRQVKSRYGTTGEIRLWFDGATQRFSDTAPPESAEATGGDAC